MEKITKENFDKYKTKLEELIKNNTPKNSKEFSEFCEKIFGFEVVDSFVVVYPSNNDIGVSVKYEIKNPNADQIRDNEIFNMWQSYYYRLKDRATKKGYFLVESDPFKLLLKTTFGELSCGGIASCYYGQTDCEGISTEQICNLMNWDERNNTDKITEMMQEQSNQLKEIFGFDPLNT